MSRRYTSPSSQSQKRYREIEPHGRATLEAGEEGLNDGRRGMEGYRVKDDEPYAQQHGDHYRFNNESHTAVRQG